jgi:hypothetical protein
LVGGFAAAGFAGGFAAGAFLAAAGRATARLRAAFAGAALAGRRADPAGARRGAEVAVFAPPLRFAAARCVVAVAAFRAGADFDAVFFAAGFTERLAVCVVAGRFAAVLLGRWGGAFLAGRFAAAFEVPAADFLTAFLAAVAVPAARRTLAEPVLFAAVRALLAAGAAVLTTLPLARVAALRVLFAAARVVLAAARPEARAAFREAPAAFAAGRATVLRAGAAFASAATREPAAAGAERRVTPWLAAVPPDASRLIAVAAPPAAAAAAVVTPATGSRSRPTSRRSRPPRVECSRAILDLPHPSSALRPIADLGSAQDRTMR